jgi:murein DD-endopeptidase MepM/ murein hydrolase activator NlpD
MKNKGVWLTRTRKLVIISLLAVAIAATPALNVSASLKDQLENSNRAEEAYLVKKDQAQKEAKSLAERIASMDEQIKQINKEIKQTKSQIKETKIEIKSASAEIDQKEKELIYHNQILDEAVKYIYEETNQPFIYQVLGSDTFSRALDRAQYLDSTREKIADTLTYIEELKNDLENRREYLLIEKNSLDELGIQLKASKKEIKNEQKDKEILLSKTKGKEERYQMLVEARQVEQQRILEKIQNLDNRKEGKHYEGRRDRDWYKKRDEDSSDEDKDKESREFIWPLKRFHLTQEYGMTGYAKSGAYNGKPHNGIDLSSVSNKKGFIDLRVRSVMDGRVIMVAPESISGGWGNAVVIEHPNGLFTLYGHLSRVVVKEGQRVSQGQMIGIEGNTGFSTGRHLHFSVYMSINIYRTSWYYGPGYDFELTLNPIKFLPKL